MSESVKPIDVTIRSWLNHDGYECENRGYKMDELDELKSVIGDRPINWHRGKNTFAGKLVSDKFMQGMKMRLLHELGRSENDITSETKLLPKRSKTMSRDLANEVSLGQEAMFREIIDGPDSP